MKSTLQTFLSGLVDYAGLFPPAAESMPAAAANYSRFLAGPFRFALGRFLVPAPRLAELAAAAPPAASDASAWRIGLLAGPDIAAALALAAEFERAQAGRFLIDSVEAKAPNPSSLQLAMAAVPEHCSAFFEVPLDPDPTPLLEMLSGTRFRAKIRTGGLTPEAIPTTAQVARFLVRAAALRVPFKATAGLHHPFRSSFPLTYEPSSPRAVMHGFVNLFLAAAFAWEGMTESSLACVLDAVSPADFVFGPRFVRFRDAVTDVAQIAAARAAFALGFGSCSFDEPFEGLQAEGLL